MKLKNILKYLFIAALAMQLASCDNKEDVDPIFNQTPTERLNVQKKELNDLLESSEFGWKAVYFTDTTQLGGFTHLFKFKSGSVEMASDFDNDTAIYKSEYGIELGSTVSLVFTTKNRIHLLSDSNNFPVASLRGKGYKGDFQFLYYGQDNGQIIFKTNRSFQELRFVKATAQDWADLPKNIAMIPNVVGASTRPLFRLLETNDGSKTSQFDFNFTGATRYATANSIETGSNITSNIGIAYTATGIIVSPPVKVGNQNLTDFTYDSVSGAFTAAGTNNVTATIKYSNKPLVLTDDYKKLLAGNPNNVYAYIYNLTNTASTNSLLFNTILTELKLSLPAGAQLTRIQPWFNNPDGSNYIEYRFGNATGATIARYYHYFTVKEDATNKVVILNPLQWKTSTLSTAPVIAAPAFLKKLDDQLMNPNGLYFIKQGGLPYPAFTLTGFNSTFRMTVYPFQ
ncbi:MULTISPECIES: DUF4302 domain-containing protein [unclassified Flavobacterium]|uniref:DUF4302 domain-containing protein n=1 Tax=unclassified Flavobacterium TaxID=196869 RepID=UPI00131B31D2|nr:MULTISPECIES: DUF4302 domain-containing protein [unclassified Flavobacterium]